MTNASSITLDNIINLIEKMLETEYRRGYADAFKEKELTEKHWKQAEVTDLLHGLWKDRIKEREDKTE